MVWHYVDYVLPEYSLHLDERVGTALLSIWGKQCNCKETNSYGYHVNHSYSVIYKYYMVRGKIWHNTFPEVLMTSLSSRTCDSLVTSTEGKKCALFSRLFYYTELRLRYEVIRVVGKTACIARKKPINRIDQ